MKVKREDSEYGPILMCTVQSKCKYSTDINDLYHNSEYTQKILIETVISVKIECCEIRYIEFIFRGVCCVIGGMCPNAGIKGYVL